MRRIFLFSWYLLICGTVLASGNTNPPKLVVIISIDQFRQDYLVRFSEHFSGGGFNLFLQKGANFNHAHYGHSSTSTGPGHAVVASGTYGNVNGIIANKWYDVAQQQAMYCVGDEDAALVGAKGEGRSPRNFIGSTVGYSCRETGSA